MEPVDFNIISAPVGIAFVCPHCSADTGIPWGNMRPPDCWVNDWPDVVCPECGQQVALGDFEYD